MGARKKLWVQIAKGKAKLNGDQCNETTDFTRRNIEINRICKKKLPKTHRFFTKESLRTNKSE